MPWSGNSLVATLALCVSMTLPCYGDDQSISDDLKQDAQESPDYRPPDPAAAAAAQDPALASRRAMMIKACEDNNGIDCATQVDTELGAEQLEKGGQRHFLTPGNR
jgi:hypothetical protein